MLNTRRSYEVCFPQCSEVWQIRPSISSSNAQVEFAQTRKVLYITPPQRERQTLWHFSYARSGNKARGMTRIGTSVFASHPSADINRALEKRCRGEFAKFARETSLTRESDENAWHTQYRIRKIPLGILQSLGRDLLF